MSPDDAKKIAYISPASLHLPPERVSGMFKGFPRTYIVAGGAERILDEIRTLKCRMIRDLNMPGETANIDPTSRRPDGTFPWVVYDEVEDGVHDFLTIHWHQPEVDDTWVRIADWMQFLMLPETLTPAAARSRANSFTDTISDEVSSDSDSDGPATPKSALGLQLFRRPLLQRMFSISGSTTSVSTLSSSPTLIGGEIGASSLKEYEIQPKDTSSSFFNRLYPAIPLPLPVEVQVQA